MRTICVTVTFLFLAGPATAAELTEVWRVQGLSNPESALFDPVAKIIYVSNVAGGPGDKDGKGFISRLSTEGKVENSRMGDRA